MTWILLPLALLPAGWAWYCARQCDRSDERLRREAREREAMTPMERAEDLQRRKYVPFKLMTELEFLDPAAEIAAAIQEAVAEEREAIAREFDAQTDHELKCIEANGLPDNWLHHYRKLAQLIRARKDS